MAASFSKPTVEGRRLFEFLEEQQEPFNVYLSKNGYSDRLLGARSTPRLLKLRNNIGLKKKGGIFKSVLNKLVQAKVALRAFKLNCAELGDRRMCVSDCHCDIVKKKQVTNFMQSDDPELSPSSVLDLHSHDTTQEKVESSSSSIKSANVSWLFLHLLKFYQSPAALSKEILKVWRCRERFDSENAKKIIDAQISCWEEQRGNISRIYQLIDLELARTRKEWSDLKNERREIGNEIEAIVFEEMREELVFDMLDFIVQIKRCKL